MELSLFLVVLFVFSKLTLFSEIVDADSSSLQLQRSCHGNERSALLQFKESFLITKSASKDEGAYPKILQWKSDGVNSTSDCCKWDGIQCDEDTGYVISLHLNSGCLFGSINSNSSLFRLVHLRSLDLSDNHFNYSQIPATIKQLSGLISLNLSSSRFVGQVPIEISQLSKLEIIDLSFNKYQYDEHKYLELKIPHLPSVLQNLSSLQILDLSHANISSTVPNFLSNFSSLRSLLLSNCELYGDFPTRIFLLPNLKILDVRFNWNLNGYFPEFYQRSPLTTLKLGITRFSGSLPSSIEKLHLLNWLNVYDCNFSGSIPSSFGKLTQLTYLDLAENNFDGYIPSSFQNLTQLTFLALEKNNFGGYLPSFGNLNQLKTLTVHHNKIIGTIPHWLGNLTNLDWLDFSHNQFHGSIPQSLSKLINLEYFNLFGNNLNGTVRFNMFFNMKNLTKLILNGNNLSLLFEKTNTNATISKFELLGLAACNINEFPDFLRYQNKLEWLSLSENNIHGHIPKWMWNTSVDTLASLLLEKNFITGFDKLPTVLPWINLSKFDLSDNMVQGALPLPPPSIMYYSVAKNMLAGEISTMFCNMSSLNTFDLSNNNLGGAIPQCLGNLSISLSMLNLRNNSFHGSIPQLCGSNESNLMVIDVSYNELQGQLPRSLSNCMMLESIVVSNNQLNDTFPSWLGSLAELKVITLRDNGFYGKIGKPQKDLQFSKLQVIDLSFNNFTGELPSQYIFGWNSMKAIDISNSPYMHVAWHYSLSSNYLAQNNWSYSITITTKGIEIHYGAIQDIYAFVDLSSNRFEGEIPDSFGNLKGLRSLNLSNNMLTGHIPSSLGNLTMLESLDLSQNNLFGEIPQQLKQLGFLARFNISHNNLTGPIPQGNQFNTFDNSSFEGNPTLCGDQLLKKCRNSQFLPPSPSTFEEDYDGESPLKLDWKFMVAGYASGLVVGVVLGNIVIMRRPRWFLKVLPKRNNLGRRQRS